MSLKNFNVDLNEENSNKRLVSLLKKNGYAIITNHNVQTELLDDVIEQWKVFFDSNEKYQWIRTDKSDEGYIPLNGETMKKDIKADFKELYQAHYKSEFPSMINTSLTTMIFDGLVSLGEKLSNLIDSGLPNNIKNYLYDNLVKISSGCNNHIMRVLHYPPILDDYSKQRSEAHSDIALFTLAFGKFFSGLELQDSNGKWFTLDCNDKSIVIFTSEMLEIYTENYFRSVMHRVPTDPKICSMSRYSIVFGFHPFRQSQLSKDLTAAQYLSKRLIEMGYDGSQLDNKDY